MSSSKSPKSSISTNQFQNEKFEQTNPEFRAFQLFGFRNEKKIYFFFFENFGEVIKMDIQKLLTTKCARKEARKSKKKWAKIVKQAKTQNLDVSF